MKRDRSRMDGWMDAQTDMFLGVRQGDSALSHGPPADVTQSLVNDVWGQQQSARPDRGTSTHHSTSFLTEDTMNPLESKHNFATLLFV